MYTGARRSNRPLIFQCGVRTMAFSSVCRCQQKEYLSVTTEFCYMCADDIKNNRPLSFSVDNGVL